MVQPQDGANGSERARREEASWPARLLIGGSILFSVVFIGAASLRNLTTLENVLLQTFTLGIGLTGSYIYGRDSSRNAAHELIRPVARSAFRRLVTIYRGFAQLSLDIAAAREQSNGQLVNSAVLDRLEATVAAHTLTAGDALADWEDMVPDEVYKLRAALTSASTGESRK